MLSDRLWGFVNNFGFFVLEEARGEPGVSSVQWRAVWGGFNCWVMDFVVLQCSRSCFRGKIMVCMIQELYFPYAVLIWIEESSGSPSANLVLMEIYLVMLLIIWNFEGPVCFVTGLHRSILPFVLWTGLQKICTTLQRQRCCTHGIACLARERNFAEIGWEMSSCILQNHDLNERRVYSVLK